MNASNCLKEEEKLEVLNDKTDNELLRLSGIWDQSLILSEYSYPPTIVTVYRKNDQLSLDPRCPRMGLGRRAVPEDRPTRARRPIGIQHR